MFKVQMSKKKNRDKRPRKLKYLLDEELLTRVFVPITESISLRLYSTDTESLYIQKLRES